VLAGLEYGVVLKWHSLLLQGMGVSLALTGLAIIGGILLGVLLALMRLSRFAPLALAAGGYVNFFRAMPLILVIFWFYFLVPLLLGRPVGPFYSVLIAFTLFEAAYYSEIIRAGIQSVTRGQINAGLAVGLTYLQTMRHVVLPQAFRNMVPILVTQAIILFQDTSLVYVVGLRDFLTTADMIVSIDNRPVELYTFAAAVYLVICLTGSLWVRRLRRRYAI
jgi:glutamate/aspartate transport system permease protein